MNRPTLTLERKGSSGRVPHMKGCLKSPMPSPGCPSSSCSTRKTVAFGQEGTEEVHFADVWDRTPMEPARKLTYQDLLELKEVQRSLPRAHQLADPFTGKPAANLLRTVPIGLLPLLPEASNAPLQPSPETVSPAASSPSAPTGLSSYSPWAPPVSPPPIKSPASSSPWNPPHLAHLLPAKPPAQRQKPNFAFLPLLDTPPSSTASSPNPSFPSSRSPSPDVDVHSDTDNSHDPPTPSLTNASLDSSPLSRASSLSPEPAFLQLPLIHGHEQDQYNHDRKSPSCNRYSESHEALAFRMASMTLTTSSRPPKTTSWQAFPTTTQKSRSSSISPPRSNNEPPKDSKLFSSRPRNVMIVNGIEIDLDEEDGGPSTAVPSSSPRRPSSMSSSSPAVSCDRGREHQYGPTPPTTKQSTCSPTFAPSLSSSPGKCTMSLCSPVRFQRDKSKVGFQGHASP